MLRSLERRLLPLATLVLVGWTTTGCTGEPAVSEVTVVGTDYAFDVADTLPSGPTVFVLENQGAVEHELGMGLLKEGLTMEEAMASEQEGGDPLEESLGFVYADPGERSPSGLLVDLESGRRYGLVCLLQDHPDAAQHVELGMHDSFVVE